MVDQWYPGLYPGLDQDLNPFGITFRPMPWASGVPHFPSLFTHAGMQSSQEDSTEVSDGEEEAGGMVKG